MIESRHMSFETTYHQAGFVSHVPISQRILPTTVSPPSSTSFIPSVSPECHVLPHSPPSPSFLSVHLGEWIRFHISAPYTSWVLKTNMPKDFTIPFDRNQWQTLAFSSQFGVEGTVDLCAIKPGSFDFWVTKSSNDTLPAAKYIHHFHVLPKLMIGDQIQPLNGLCMQTMIVKCMGPLSNWENHYELAASLKYNCIHLTPVSKLGKSNSAYSIRDQLCLAKSIFPNHHTPSENITTLAAFIKRMEHDLGVLTIADVVWNHTASDTNWLIDHPEAGYHVGNSPHLEPAALLDEALITLTQHMEAGQVNGVPTHVQSEKDLSHCFEYFSNSILPPLALWEYYMVDVASQVEIFRQWVEERQDIQPICFSLTETEKRLDIIRRAVLVRQSGRFPFTINPSVLITLYTSGSDLGSGHSHMIPQSMSALDHVCDLVTLDLKAINAQNRTTYDHDITYAIENLKGHVRYERLDANGPQRSHQPISLQHPLVPNYFTRIRPNVTYGLPLNSHGELAIANNGWIMNADPQVDFASCESSAYFKREIVIWTDCVKLRYGSKPDDNPWLWEHMAEYTGLTAQLFHGIRIDNCHSTPLHVGRYLLDVARSRRPNLYVVAELFTSSAKLDQKYVQTLGITGLVREAMQAHSPHDLSSMIYRYGGIPIGSLGPNMTRKPNAILMDQTHDNNPPCIKRTMEDSLTNAAVVAMCDSIIGSTRGYDELVPHRIHVVNETRQYSTYSKSQINTIGMMRMRKQLNALHQQLGLDGFSEQHIEQDDTLLTITRHHPLTRESVLMICNLAFEDHQSNIKPVSVPGKIRKFLFWARIIKSHEPNGDISEFIPASSSYTAQFVSDHPAAICDITEEYDHDAYSMIHFNGNFQFGTVVAFRIALFDSANAALDKIHTICHAPQVNHSLSLEFPIAKLEVLLRKLSFVDFNILLFRTNEEERAVTQGTIGVYNLPEYGDLSFCGLWSVALLFKTIQRSSQMDHPLMENLRKGNWLILYMLKRLQYYPSLKQLRKFLKQYFSYIVALPRYLVPHYFGKMVLLIVDLASKLILELISTFITEDSPTVIQQLAVASLQFYGPGSFVVPSHELDGSRNSLGSNQSSFTGSSDMLDTLVMQYETSQLLNGIDHPITSTVQDHCTMAAGFPHFASGFMRAWGRDTFIALRGLMLITNRLDDAQSLILRFAACVHHGLVPNLYDSGNHPRYNARDATWFFLQSIQDFCHFSKSTNILTMPVERMSGDWMSLADIVQEILQSHAQGINFCEWNAGPNLDQHMNQEGFEVNITLDPSTGFIKGGNLSNCGTWMDKMGSSHQGRNAGIPATPRDGAAIEIIGLLGSTIKWLDTLNSEDVYPFNGVTLPDNSTLSFRQWHILLQQSFESHFWIPIEPDHDSEHILMSKYIHKRGIYKDTVGSTTGWTDYQLRPNQCVAMVVAPHLFNPIHARHALSVIDAKLKGPLGIKTLDPDDWNYRADYHNHDGHEYHTACGFNYHQGPEWVWLTGYFLRAKLHFSTTNSSTTTREVIASSLLPLLDHVNQSPFRSLPELTNDNGATCHDSCVAQAWSHAGLLDILHDIQPFFC